MSQFIIYGIFAMSLALIWGQLGLLCFGQAVFFGIGAYSMTLVTKGMIQGAEGITSSYAGLGLAVLLPAFVANLLGRFLFYGKGLSGGYFAIVTLSVAIIIERVAINWEYIGGFNGLTGIPPLDFGIGPLSLELIDSIHFYYFILALAGALLLILSTLIHSTYGSVLRAVRDNEDRTAYFGYDSGSYKLAMFTLSAGIAGLAGGIFVTQFGFVAPSLIGFALSTEVLIWVAVGGKTALLSAFLGAIVVRSVEGILAERLGYYWLLALGIGFIATVVLLPRGLIGTVLEWRPRALRRRRESCKVSEESASGASAQSPSSNVCRTGEKHVTGSQYPQH